MILADLGVAVVIVLGLVTFVWHGGGGCIRNN